MVDPATLNPHPLNPKLHDTGLLRASVAKGLYRAVVVNIGTHTGRPNEILAGHGTREAWMAEHPGEPLQVSLIDVDDDRAAEIVLVDNPGPNDPGYDNRRLFELLTSLDDLTVTGYDGDDIAAILAAIDEDNPLPPIHPIPPDGFKEYGDDVEVTYGCPSCGYEWSGRPHPNALTHTARDADGETAVSGADDARDREPAF